ncbi:MAG TPA: Gfo/Idh/MocA family oxidoreductase [Candidatus Dormibacteraeota bacterium]|nr:Gfo/Idh/MocA family oxidoreductase [Candidatus Dormibacteraeota bacterium]
MKHSVAIIGLGFVGRAHLESLRRLGIPVKGGMLSTAERGSSAAKSLGLEKSYASLAELAADKEITCVHICSPNHVHFEQASALLRAGKHVLCEKPLAMDSRESQTLKAIEKETGFVGGVAHNLRYYPLCQEARAMVKSGAIGKPLLVHGKFHQDWLLFPSDWNWRLESKLGGDLRAVSDIGTHWMDLAMFVTGSRITEVCADLATIHHTRRKPRGHVESFAKASAGAYDEVPISTDDYASVLVHFENDLRGFYSVSQVSAGRKCSLGFEVNGSEGSLAWNAEDPNMLWIGRREKANESLIKDPSLLSPAARGYAAYPGGHTEGYPDTFVQLFKDYYAYLDAADFKAPRSFPTFSTGHDELVLCETIAQSAEKRAWLEIPWD